MHLRYAYRIPLYTAYAQPYAYSSCEKAYDTHALDIQKTGQKYATKDYESYFCYHTIMIHILHNYSVVLCYTAVRRCRVYISYNI